MYSNLLPNQTAHSILVLYLHMEEAPRRMQHTLIIPSPCRLVLKLQETARLQGAMKDLEMENRSQKAADTVRPRAKEGACHNTLQRRGVFLPTNLLFHHKEEDPYRIEHT